ncbi:restriction endonuclease subunit S [Soonwooa sp.]|uniref:restriction endonuclease subunit S n=1 Tax=Soonwooa sp. TaxID=1938592 RepID=UPI0028AB54EA|nr:restriction endonuclease subunit S [Soonwooa sp.]
MKKLGEVMDFKVTNSFSRENLNYEYGTVKNIHYGDIHTKFQTLFDINCESVPFINQEIDISRISDENYCKNGDIIFADASEDLNDVGKSIEIINTNGEKLLSGLHTLLARPKKDIFHLGFSGYLFKSNSVRTQIQKESQGSKVLSINVGRISKVELSFPSVEEQSKISSFLALLDERIQTQSKIIEQIEFYFKGIKDNLFSQKIRFGDFADDWKTKKLGDVLLKNSTKNKNQRYSTVQSVSNKYGFINQEDIFEDRRVASVDTSNYYVIDKGCFAYNPSRINVGSLAYKFDDKISIISPLYISFKAENIFLIDTFLLYWFKTIEFTKQMNNSFEGSVRNTLSYENLIKMNISIPSLEEQIQISSFLTKIDQKIQTEKTILEQLEMQKKYLLQQMFV